MLRLLPTEQQEAALVVFAWIFQANEITELEEGNPVKTLRAYREELEKVWDGAETRHLITLLFVRLAKAVDIPKKECLVFLSSLEETQEQAPFSSRQELEDWLTDSGGMAAGFFGQAWELSATGVRVLRQFGGWLGMAAVLQSVGRDWRLENQVMLPLSLLRQHEIEPQRLWEFRYTWQWRELVQEEIGRLFEEKKEIESELSALPSRIRTAVRIILELETWVLHRLNRHPVLCWNILIVEPNGALFAKTLALWSWKLAALPIVKNGWKFGRSALSRGKVAFGKR